MEAPLTHVLSTPRILLRSPNSPFDITSPATVVNRNLIANNSGNLVFLYATHRLLATPGAQITPDRMRVQPADADRINDEFDIYVAPFANAFRATFEPTLIRWAELFERLRIPVVVPGVGAQSNLAYDLEPLRPLERTVKRFVRAVLDRAPSIGVRGEFTANYLQHLGFRDVEVIGCPSMFLNGPALRVERKVDSLRSDSRIAINGSPYRATMGRILLASAARYPNLVYVAQDIATLELLSFGESPDATRPSNGFPDGPDDPLVREGRVRAFTHPWPWIEFLGGMDFTFGSRIHGNIVSLLAGTPAFVLAHDSRTLELARYFDVPHRLLPDVAPDVDAAELYAEANYERLNGGHVARWAAFEGFLQRHGLSTVFAAGGADAFDERMATLTFPSLGGPEPLTTRVIRRLFRRYVPRQVLQMARRVARFAARRRWRAARQGGR